MQDLRFSIVIPTRERPETLKYCLKTCIEQELFSNYEIIVSDNNSSPATKEVVDSFKCDKIRYFPTGTTLPMYENFEFAVSKAKGEYVMVLGDDDGILLKALYNLDQIIRKTGYKAITWQWIFYSWPEGVPPGTENIMYIPLSAHFEVHKGLEAIKEVLNFTKPYNQLPMLYINGAIHRDLIQELRNKTGRVFSSVTPDAYSGICFAYLSKYFLFLSRPLSIAGISGKSNGNNQLYKKWNNAIHNEFSSLNDSSSIGFHHKVPYIRSLNAIVAEVFMQAKERLFSEDKDLVLDRKLMIVKSIEDLQVFDMEEWDYSIGLIRDTLKDDNELLIWYDDVLLEYKPKIKDINHKQVIKTGVINNTLVINGSSFKCSNVYDVARFYDDILESEIQIPENIRAGETNHQPDRPQEKVTLLRKAYLRLRHASRVVVKGY